MLLSDHGTVGDHTESAYLGCTRPINAESVLDVREEIERILKDKEKYMIMQTAIDSHTRAVEVGKIDKTIG